MPRESDPSAGETLKEYGDVGRVASSRMNEPVTYDKVELVHPGVVPVKE